jgi:hypothetical protein
MAGRSFADDSEMAARAKLAHEFYAATGAEEVPWVSDEANWYTFDYVNTAELICIVEAYYGVRLSEELLRMPFWRLLDYIQAHRQHPPGERFESEQREV